MQADRVTRVVIWSHALSERIGEICLSWGFRFCNQQLRCYDQISKPIEEEVIFGSGDSYANSGLRNPVNEANQQGSVFSQSRHPAMLSTSSFADVLVSVKATKAAVLLIV